MEEEYLFDHVKRFNKHLNLNKREFSAEFSPKLQN